LKDDSDVAMVASPATPELLVSPAAEG